MQSETPEIPKEVKDFRASFCYLDCNDYHYRVQWNAGGEIVATIIETYGFYQYQPSKQCLLLNLIATAYVRETFRFRTDLALYFEVHNNYVNIAGWQYPNENINEDDIEYVPLDVTLTWPYVENLLYGPNIRSLLPIFRQFVR